MYTKYVQVCTYIHMCGYGHSMAVVWITLTTFHTHKTGLVVRSVLVGHQVRLRYNCLPTLLTITYSNKVINLTICTYGHT